MKFLFSVITVVILLISCMFITPAGAEIFIEDSSRKGRFEMFLLTNWIDSNQIDFQGGSEIGLDKDFGLGFGFAYNLNEHIALGANFIWNSSKYDVSTFSDTGDPVNMSGRLDSNKMHFTATYYFFDKIITPFITGGFGWTLIDSNVPSGPPSSHCWWDPWWGYVCSRYQSTYSETSFSYSIGTGLRMDITKTFFMSLSINNTWIDISKAKGTPDSLNTNLLLGFAF